MDGTLLGRRASLFRDADGAFTLLGARAFEACARAEVEVVPYSGRRHSTLLHDARMLGLSSYIFEAGCGMVLDGELEWLAEGRAGRRRGARAYGRCCWGVLRVVSRSTSRGSAGGRCRGSFSAGGFDASEADQLLIEGGVGGCGWPTTASCTGSRRRAGVPPGAARGLEGARRRAPHAGARVAPEDVSRSATRWRTWGPRK